jgi:DNA-binding beta-propeller fold protein YncE
MWRKSIGANAFVMLMASASTLGAPQGAVPHFAIVERIPGPPTVTAWDYATIDTHAKRLFLSTSFRSGAGLTVLDLDSRQVSSMRGAKNMPHGVVVLDEGVVAAADAAQNAVLFFNLASANITTLVDTGKPTQADRWHNPDFLLLEPKTGLLVAVNGDSGAFSLVNVARHFEAGTIAIGGKLETAVARGDGIVFVNVESRDAIAVIDVPERKLVHEFPLKDCDEPTGLDYDVADRLIISVCGNGVAKFIDPDSGSELASLDVAHGADAVIYDSQRKIVFIAGGDDGKLSIIQVVGRREIRVIQNLRTQPGVRLGAVDPTTGTLYLPSAKPDMKAPPLHLPAMPPIPPAARGSFEFLVVRPARKTASR